MVLLEPVPLAPQLGPLSLRQPRQPLAELAEQRRLGRAVVVDERPVDVEQDAGDRVTALAQASTGTASDAIASICAAARSNSSSESTGVPSNGSSRCSSIHDRQPWYSGRTLTVTGRGMR